MNKTSIEWTDYTWNPVRARRKDGKAATSTRDHGTFCTKISPGCKNCYASVINRRFGTGLEFEVPNLALHEFFLDEKELAAPLKLKTPARIFVGDMFDLFHEAIPTEFIAEVLRVALKIPRHTFQFLTKRAQRMQNLVNRAQKHWGVEFGRHMQFGVSIEDQARHNERAPLLQGTKAAIRFLSIEPLLEHVNLWIQTPEVGAIWTLEGFAYSDPEIPGIDWVICGGESGPRARPFNLEWAEEIKQQCENFHTPFFMKQIGSNPRRDGSRYLGQFDGYRRNESDAKGGNMDSWPAELRVREFPSQKNEAVNA